MARKIANFRCCFDHFPSVGCTGGARRTLWLCFSLASSLGGCFLETLGSVPSRMLFWTQFSFLISRFQLQHRNRKCIRKRRQPWVQQRNLLPSHPSMRVQPLEPTWSLLVTQGHTTSPIGTLVLTSPAWALRHFSFLSSDTPCLHLPISLHPGVPSSPVLCLPSLVTLFLFLIFQSFM